MPRGMSRGASFFPVPHYLPPRPLSLSRTGAREILKRGQGGQEPYFSGLLTPSCRQGLVRFWPFFAVVECLGKVGDLGSLWGLWGGISQKISDMLFDFSFSCVTITLVGVGCIQGELDAGLGVRQDFQVSLLKHWSFLPTNLTRGIPNHWPMPSGSSTSSRPGRPRTERT